MDKVQVIVEQGILNGAEFATDNGFKYYGFLGIPYAKPPVGDLRFQGPQPPEPWDGERDATEPGNAAVQLDLFEGIISGDEDCLYLSVYTANLTEKRSELLPVIVYIHAGGFVFGTGSSKEDTGPDFLIEHDVVIVSINYRLNVFGFLSLDLPKACGNMGLKDQVAALKWIQNNIASFGGDTNNVTLFGCSAGAASVEYLMLSPQAKGLYHKAILQSGSALNHWAINTNIKNLSMELASALGFRGTTEEDVYNFLMVQNSIELARKAFELVEKHKSNLFFGWVPSIEKDFSNGEGLILEDPYKLFKLGRVENVPVLKGFSNSEGFIMRMMNPNEVNELVETQDFTKVIPEIFSKETKDIGDKLKKIYLSCNNNDFSVEYFSDLDFVSGIWISSKIMADHGLPVFTFRFDYAGEKDLSRMFYEIMKPGAARYVIATEKYGVIKTELDARIKDQMLTLFTNFAKSGNPTPDTTTFPLEWPHFAPSQTNYLVIDEVARLESNYEPDRMKLFEELYGSK